MDIEIEMNPLAELAEFEARDGFVARHIAPSESDIAAMLEKLGITEVELPAGKAAGKDWATSFTPPVEEPDLDRWEDDGGYPGTSSSRATTPECCDPRQCQSLMRSFDP